MIPGLSPLSLSTGYILAGLLSCDPQTAPTVTLQFQNAPLQINNTRSSSDLARMKTHTLSPQYGAEFPVVGGATSSDLQIKYNAEFMTSSALSSDSVCLWAKAINITVIYAPVIYISSDYKPGSCQYSLTEEHERLHVNIDIITLNEFLPYIRREAENAVSAWRGTGPVGKNQTESNQEALLKPVADALGKVTSHLQRTRSLRQQQVDSRSEYRYVSSACRKKDSR
ncbi:MAG: hypothetical protein V1721_01630 [Pseudomonadota bacterium]